MKYLQISNKYVSYLLLVLQNSKMFNAHTNYHLDYYLLVRYCSKKMSKITIQSMKEEHEKIVNIFMACLSLVVPIKLDFWIFQPRIVQHGHDPRVLR